ncbi:hypothetical protein Shyhy01_02120 [Streptomyces hygroscopicus subsp. hygroscopicus]|nr:hypothetical protein Shyhy01_02120 [Streptomyces hygroscopicus subsp. hygroscopicus]
MPPRLRRGPAGGGPFRRGAGAHGTPPHRHRFGDPEPDPVGRVRGPDRRPVPRARVTLPGPGGHRLVATVTNARGEYAATALPRTGHASRRPCRAGSRQTGGGCARAASYARDFRPRDRAVHAAGHASARSRRRPTRAGLTSWATADR